MTDLIGLFGLILFGLFFSLFPKVVAKQVILFNEVIFREKLDFDLYTKVSICAGALMLLLALIIFLT